MNKKLPLHLLLYVLFAGLLPAQNFPAYKITACDTSSEGYYFMGVVNANNGPNVMYPMIMDDKGRMVYYAAASTGDFKIQRNGLMSFFKQKKFYLMDSTFTVVDSAFCKHGLITDSHDFQVLPNGHFLLLGFEEVTMDLSAYHVFSHNGSPGDTNAVVRFGVIQEQDANKNVVFEWRSKNYFTFNDMDTAYMNNPGIVDLEHFNAIELDTDGNLLLSMRHFNEIAKINRSDSSVMWRLGGKQNQFNFTNDPARFIAQHDIRRIANGHITLYDDGDNAPPFHPATAKEYSIDETAHTATLVWSYVQNAASYSQAMGSVQRLANGNTVVDYGMMQNDSAAFTVVKPSGAKVFEAAFTYMPASYRAFNYPALPWQLQRPQITCYNNGGQYYLDAGSGYAGYGWSTGATTQTIAVTSADSFFVFVPAGNTGFIASEYFFVANHTSPCGLPSSAAEANGDAEISVYPNPVSEQLLLRSSSFTGGPIAIEVFDFTGRKVYAANAVPHSHTLNLAVGDLAAGIYAVRSGDYSSKFVKE